MTLKEYIDRVGNDAIMVSEWCGTRFITNHTAFGIGDKVHTDDGVKDKSNYFQLWEDGQSGCDVTEIGIHQEITFCGDAVCVMDTQENKLELFFYRGEIIHPPLDK